MHKAVEIKSKNLTLRGMLHIPQNLSKKIPIVVIFHGFCGNKMGPHFMFVKLSRELERLGIASLRFDFAGTGESDGDFIDMTLTKELEDANNILDYVKSLDFIDNDKIGVFGFSMGGAISSILSGDRKDDVSTLCLLAPAGNMHEVILSDYYIGKSYKDFIRDGYFDVEGLLVGREFVEDVRNLRIYERAKAYDKQVLIIHGDKDEVVALSASEKYIDIYGETSELKIIQGANHTFDKKEWEDEVIESVAGYFSEEFIVAHNYLMQAAN